MLLTPSPCHKLSYLLGPPPPRAWRTLWTVPNFMKFMKLWKLKLFSPISDLLWLNSIGRYMYVLPRKCSAMAQSRISAYVGPLARNYLPKSWSGIASPLTSSVLSSGDALGFSYLVDPGTWPIQITFIILHMHYNLRCMVQPNLLVTIS